MNKIERRHKLILSLIKEKNFTRNKNYKNCWN